MSKEAMKLALEALENFEKAGLATLKTIDAITALKQALEQPEPEPVECHTCKGLGRIYMGCGSWIHCDTCNTTGKATTQPKREWQGLTDEEIDEGQRQSWVDKQAFESAVWWAEAKLKEKNT